MKVCALLLVAVPRRDGANRPIRAVENHALAPASAWGTHVLALPESDHAVAVVMLHTRVPRRHTAEPRHGVRGVPPLQIAFAIDHVRGALPKILRAQKD